MKKCEMFCYQCQETARGTGCTKVGVCGKRPELSSMLDLLIYVTVSYTHLTLRFGTEARVSSTQKRIPTRSAFSRRRMKTSVPCAR